MNVTISADPRVIERAREKARDQGTSLEGLLRKFLESLAGERPAEALAEELLGLMREHGGHSGGSFRREDAYDDRL